MIKYQCDICSRPVTNKTTGFILNIEPLIDMTKINGVPTPEDAVRLRTISKSVLICSRCYSNLFKYVSKEPMPTHMTIAIGDKKNAMLVATIDEVVTREMRINLDPDTVHKIIIKYLSEIDIIKKGGTPNGQEKLQGSINAQ